MSGGTRLRPDRGLIPSLPRPIQPIWARGPVRRGPGVHGHSCGGGSCPRIHCAGTAARDVAPAADRAARTLLAELNVIDLAGHGGGDELAARMRGYELAAKRSDPPYESLTRATFRPSRITSPSETGTVAFTSAGFVRSGP